MGAKRSKQRHAVQAHERLLDTSAIEAISALGIAGNYAARVAREADPKTVSSALQLLQAAERFVTTIGMRTERARRAG